MLTDVLDHMSLLLDEAILFLIQSFAIFGEMALASTAEALILPRVHFSHEHSFFLCGNIEGSIWAASNINNAVLLHGSFGPIILIKTRFAFSDHLYSHRPVESSPGRALSVEMLRQSQPNIFCFAHIVPTLLKS